MNLYKLNNGMFKFNNKIDTQSRIILYMIDLGYSPNEIGIAIADMDECCTNVANFGIVNKLFIFSFDSKENMAC